MLRGTTQRAFFWLAYRLHRTPWDTGISPPELVERVEGAAALPPGRALDIGCGTGTNSIYLAQHGWEVSGVDFTGRALVTARRKAAGAGVRAQFLQGDATRLGALGLSAGFDLVLDIGCFHSVPADRRAAYAGGVAALARLGATFLLFCFRRADAGPPSIPDQEVRRVLAPGFELVQVLPGEGRWDPAWYVLHRR
ncbi:MAG TPA: class I SAM-dependent methyltransferase [Candidatus Dormibacteraeota bacterium]|nr:class I SAM-dependent methyltransferase [Candidatus Dormibacteraeota bacterium]